MRYQPAVSRRLFRCFGGTPPPKPLICKIVSNRLGARFRSAWAHHVGGTPLRSCLSAVVACFSRRRLDARIRLALSDIIKTSLCYRSQSFTFRCCHSPSVSGKQKTLLPYGKQGEKKSFSLRRYLLARSLIEAQPITGLTRQPTESDCTAFNRPIMTCRGQGDLSHRPVRGGYVHASFHRTWETFITRA